MSNRIRAVIMATSMTIAVMTQAAILAPAGAASPDAPREDVFGRSTYTPPPPHSPVRGHVTTGPVNPAIHPSAPAPADPHPFVTPNSPPQQWFDAYDTYVVRYKATQEDELNLQKPFNQEVERVTNFCNTVAKLARNYRILAQKIKSMPIPTSTPEARTLRDQMADWYKDSAELYTDMIRPRPAARTKEELNSMIQDISGRSESLKQIAETLKQMDTDLRRHYSVTPPKYDDALYTYTGHDGHH